MCGFTGILDPRTGGDTSLLARMAATLEHRGPDDAGTWSDPRGGLGLAHRRLSIQDLSAAGHQPMMSRSGRWVIAFNGEIYNHLEMRHALEARGAPGWRGHSDTETLLAGFEADGIEATLRASVGMFAIAVWDRESRTLVLARDRLGEKPLYYGWHAGAFLFGSELKALRAHPAFDATLDREAVARYMRYGYVPAPATVHAGTFKLPPGTLLEVPVREDGRAARDVVPRAWWSMREAVERGLADPLDVDDDEAADRVEDALRRSVAGQLLSDVPVGAFLSGGVDSTTVVALMRAVSSAPVRTFAIGFAEAGYDEAQHAAAVARHLGTEHVELYVGAAEALEVVPRLPTIYDEPFADVSQIPTYLVSALARRHVAVALSGDAGDELFGGYTRYFTAASIWGVAARTPAPLRRWVAHGLSSVPAARWDALHGWVAPALPGRLRAVRAGEKLHKLARTLGARHAHETYRELVSHWRTPADLVIGAHEPADALTDPSRWPATDSLQHHMMAMDALTYLPDDILAKVDRAAMAVSLETRVPFLDHRVVELAWRLPLATKVRDGEGKRVLKRVLHRHVPRELVDRPKMGFGVPIGGWLRGPLREWADALLEPGRVAREGVLEPRAVSRAWREHLAGERDWSQHLWNVLMFQAWHESLAPVPARELAA
ncbi:MAG TPA: asparagine synthase (glutamine-hydrolyzing) [Burkholderiaceae bacterium]|nr:asparagine synthase (glutamine-hydrolyzing) [Burkholderiaceae bacterium]